MRKLWEDSQFENIQVVLQKKENILPAKIDPRIQTMNSVIFHEKKN